MLKQLTRMVSEWFAQNSVNVFSYIISAIVNLKDTFTKPVEAPRAADIGTFAIAIITVTLVTIILLDVVAVCKDLRQMRGTAAAKLPLAKLALYVMDRVQIRLDQAFPPGTTCNFFQKIQKVWHKKDTQ